MSGALSAVLQDIVFIAFNIIVTNSIGKQMLYKISPDDMRKDHWNYLKNLIEFTLSTIENDDENNWLVCAYPFAKGMVDFNRVLLKKDDMQFYAKRVDWTTSKEIMVIESKGGETLSEKIYLEDNKERHITNYVTSISIFDEIMDKATNADLDSILFGNQDVIEYASEVASLAEECGFDDEILASFAHDMSKN